MPRFARRLAWLNKVFPPAGGQQPQPTEYSQDIVLTYPSIPASSNFDDIVNDVYTGVSTFNATTDYIEPGFFWWVQACSMSHNIIAGAQHATIKLMSRKGNGAGGSFIDVILAAQLSLPTSGAYPDASLVVDKPFIVPPGGTVQAHVGAAQTGYGPELRVSYLKLPMGSVIW